MILDKQVAFATMTMTLQELQQAIHELSAEEQLVLLETLSQALKARQQPQAQRRALVDQLRGCLKQPGQSAPTDAEIEQWREARRLERHLR